VVITHNVAISGMADRVMHLADGRITTTEKNPRKLTPSELSW
jgi:putative ABC transport system ATP-binding protein